MLLTLMLKIVMQGAIQYSYVYLHTAYSYVRTQPTAYRMQMYVIARAKLESNISSTYKSMRIQLYTRDTDTQYTVNGAEMFRAVEISCTRIYT